MSYRIKNTANDIHKRHLHRIAAGFVEEPSFAGIRIRLGQSITITESQYEQHKVLLDSWVAKGMVEISRVVGVNYVDANGLRLDGPTLEEWVKAGYLAETYPPEGYASKDSPGLVAYKTRRDEERHAKEDAEAAALLKQAAEEAELAAMIAADEAKAAASVIKEALEQPSVTSQILPATPIEQAAEAASVSESAGAPSDSSVEEQSEKRGPGRPKKKLV